MANHNGRWGRWSTLLAGLPYDVQAALYNRLQPRVDLNPASVYRLPYLTSIPRQTVAAGATNTASYRFVTLTAIYGISKTFDNETVQAVGTTAGVSGLTAVYPSEVAVQISFNQGTTTWIGSTSEPCNLGVLGDANNITRVDPIIATNTDVWDIFLTGDAALANNVFSTVTLHGVKLYGANGSI